MTREEIIESLENIKYINDYHRCREGIAIDKAIEALKEPERKCGRWIEKSKWQSGRWIKWFECSICGEKDYDAEMYEDMPFTGLSNFCPNCGADMKGEQE